MAKYRCVKKHRDQRDMRKPVAEQRVVEVGAIREFAKDPGRYCWEPAPEPEVRTRRSTKRTTNDK